MLSFPSPVYLRAGILPVASVSGWNGNRILTRQTSQGRRTADAELVTGVNTCLRLSCTQQLSVSAA